MKLQRLVVLASLGGVALLSLLLLSIGSAPVNAQGASAIGHPSVIADRLQRNGVDSWNTISTDRHSIYAQEDRGPSIVPSYVFTYYITLTGLLKNYNDGQRICTSIYTVTNEGVSPGNYLHEFYDNEQGGSIIHYFNDTIAASGITAYNLANIAQIPNGYRGRVSIGSHQLFTVTLISCPFITFSISGQVTDANNNPVAGVTISAGGGRTTTTDSNGNYTLGGLPAGTYTLTPSKSGYTFTPVSRTISVPPDRIRQDFVGRLCYITGVPLYLQGWPSTPDSLPNRPPWYDHIYGNYPITYTNETIGKWGCNTSCAAMVISYFGQTIQSFETNPGELNTWLRNHKGYDKENGVIYNEVANYGWLNGVPVFVSGISGRNDTRLDAHLCSGNPAMLKVRNGDHFVLAIGKTMVNGNITYAINDPIWGSTTLRERYSDNYQAAYYYRLGPGVFNRSMIQLSAHSPVHLMVTDPLGRRSGNDPRTGMSWDEIPDAGYVTEVIGAPDGTTLPERKVLLISKPANGQYHVQVIGYNSGVYEVEIFKTNLAGDTSRESFSGTAQAGSVDSYVIQYDSSIRLYLPIIIKGN